MGERATFADRAQRHLGGLWGRHWPLPCALATAYLVFLVAKDDLRGEHVALYVGGLVLAYAHTKTKRFFVAVLPFMITGVAYDLVRYVTPITTRADRVLTCSLRDADMSLATLGGVSLPEYFAANHRSLWDLFFAVPYTVYMYVIIGLGIVLFFRDREKMHVLLWAFLLANLMAFAMWIAVPAAPPWYVIEHGCTASMSASPSPAALARVDEHLGITYFAQFYSRAASVYGAMPSMHCAYPALGLFALWGSSGRIARGAHVFYLAWMVAAAVYLVHHWVVDAIAGVAIAFVAVRASRWLVRRSRDAEAVREATLGGAPA